MDLLDRLLGHDTWTTRELLVRCQGLSDAQLDQDFDIGHRTVRDTFLHIIYNMEAWYDLMSERPVRPSERDVPERRSVQGMIARLDGASVDLTALAKNVARRNGWDETWLDRRWNPPGEKTYGAAIAHVITHSMHHRAHLLYMLRRLGVQDLPEGDVIS